MKYWYKFKNEIVFDHTPYTVTFNVRDKGTEQYQIEFREEKTPGLSNTANKSLLRTDQASHANSIPDSEKKVNTSEEKIQFSRKAEDVNAKNNSTKTKKWSEQATRFINKVIRGYGNKQSETEFLADLEKARQVYAQSVYQSHPDNSIPHSSEKVNT